MYVASGPLKYESPQLAGLYSRGSTGRSIAANQGKGTDSPAEKVTAKNEESPVLMLYLPHRCPAPQPRVFQRQLFVTWVLGLMLRRSEAEPDLLCIWETTAENSACQRW